MPGFFTDRWCSLLLRLYLTGLAALYFIYCWTHGGQTLAMKTWRLRVVMKDGGPLSLRTAVYRYLGALVSASIARGTSACYMHLPARRG